MEHWGQETWLSYIHKTFFRLSLHRPITYILHSHPISQNIASISHSPTSLDLVDHYSQGIWQCYIHKNFLLTIVKQANNLHCPLKSFWNLLHYSISFSRFRYMWKSLMANMISGLQMWLLPDFTKPQNSQNLWKSGIFLDVRIIKRTSRKKLIFVTDGK